MAKVSRGRLWSLCTLLRNLLFAGIIYGAIFGIILLAKRPGRVQGKLGIPAFLDKSGPADIIKTTSRGVKVKFAATSSSVTINPHSNVFNRPSSAVVPKDDYLGPRPHIDTEADLKMLVEECRGTYEGLEKMRNVFDCLEFMDKGEAKYYRLPEERARASRQDPREAEYNNADGHNNTLKRYVEVNKAAKPSKTSIGQCAGPIIPYHTYWAGPATWRLEAFVKSYLYTQNLPCSRLYIWIDEDKVPRGAEKMLVKDPLFARFLPFVERGDITLKTWVFPSRIPLPEGIDHTDGLGYYKTPGAPNLKGEIPVAEGIVRDESGQQYMALTPKQMTFLPQAVSDAVRFVVLHTYGGAYFDMDVLFLRDMRPLLLPKEHNFAERWAAHSHPGDFNTAILSLKANSSLSSYLLRGGVRMGLNFHPRVIGRMAWKDGRNQELLMLETAAFDPIWTEFNWAREGRCTIPCIKDYGAVFKGKPLAYKDEWESYDGEQLPLADLSKLPTVTRPSPQQQQHLEGRQSTLSKREISLQRRNHPQEPSLPEPTDSFHATSAEEEELRDAGAIAEYQVENDKYPPSNRTLEHFFRGAWTYHIHNQWMKHPEPSSWLSVIEHAHDDFFAGTRTNMYGETWTGPSLMPYNFWPEYV